MQYTLWTVLSLCGAATVACGSSATTGSEAMAGAAPATSGAPSSGGSVSAGGTAGTPPDTPEPNPNPSQAALTAHDLSVLFPLHGSASRRELWPATLEGQGGPLLPLTVYEHIGRSVFVEGESPAQEHAALRIVAVRFDPCFGADCTPQLRLVLQWIDEQGIAADGAVHALYSLDNTTFAELEQELRELAELAPENRQPGPLGVSPALAAQGLEGRYGVGLEAAVTRFAGASRLSRVTFMTRTLQRQPEWEFGGFDLIAGAATRLAIPGLPSDAPLQAFSAIFSGSQTEYSFGVEPHQLSQPALLEVLSRGQADASDEATRLAALRALAGMQNPRLENAATADCASCHFAGRLRRHLSDAYGTPPALDTEYPDAAELERVTNTAEDTDENLRAFGYFQNLPVVSRRAANETNEARKRLSESAP